MILLAADSHDVWIAAFACITVGFGVLNTYLQNRNRNVTVATTNELKAAIAENTELTQKTHDAVKDKA